MITSWEEEVCAKVCESNHTPFPARPVYHKACTVRSKNLSVFRMASAEMAGDLM